MTREQIEKAAVEYADSINMIYGSKENIIEDFIAGAEWRINSVWHDASEEPKNKNVPILVKYSTWGIDGFDYMVCDDILDYDIHRSEKYFTFLEWSYINDLLPERKEKI